MQLGRHTQAAAALRAALECPVNGAEREYLMKKLRSCAAAPLTRAALS